MKLEAVLCDIGNVAVFFDNEKTVRAFASLSKQPVDTVRRIMFSDGVGLLRRYESGKIDSAEFRRIVCARLNLSKREIPTDQTLFDAWTDVFTPNIAVLTKLCALWSHRISIAAVSNIDEMRQRKLQQLGHLTIFDHLVMSWSEKLRKPSEELMVRALDRCGTKAENTIFIDDITENLVPAAKLGIRTHQYVTTEAFDRFLESCGA